MTITKRINPSLFAVILVYVLVALWLFFRSLVPKQYSPDQVIWDQQTLLAWSLGFILCLLILRLSDVSRSTKAHLLVAVLAIFGVVTTAIILNGTPFSYNSYWGDQKFRQAMILKFVTFAVPYDFYYNNLPPFYPPLYYYLLSLYSRLFSVEFFKMLKIGNLLFFSVGPPLLYLFWSKITSHAKAAIIVTVTFIFAATVSHIAYVAPHEALANMFFVPWWLYYIEGVVHTRPTRGYLLFGGVVGGLIFMTYYYAFFIGGAILLVRYLSLGRVPYVRYPAPSRLRTQFIVLAGAAITSSLYWLPLLLSMVLVAAKPTQNEWFHAGYASMYFQFMEFSVTGFLAAAGVIFVARKPFAQLHRGLLLLVAGSVIWVVIGAILGNVGKPVLYIKAYEFLNWVSAAMIGLWLGSLLHVKGTRYTSIRRGYAFLILVALMYFCNQWNQEVTHDHIRTARTSWVRHWNTSAEEMGDRAGKVFLTGIELLPSFYPIFSFISTNEHYSHHASRYEERAVFLSLLQYVRDPRLFYVCLRHNIYDAVDYYMPVDVDGKDHIRLALSNYPNRFEEYLIDFSEVDVRGSTLFLKREGDRLFELAPESSTQHDGASWEQPPAKAERTRSRAAIAVLCDHLTERGRNLVREYVTFDVDDWDNSRLSATADFGEEVRTLAAFAVPDGDSLSIVLAFQAMRSITKSYKVMLHVESPGQIAGMKNYDFLPDPRTDYWKHGDIIICSQMILSPKQDFSFSYCLFRGSERLGIPAKVNVKIGDQSL